MSLGNIYHLADLRGQFASEDQELQTSLDSLFPPVDAPSYLTPSIMPFLKHTRAYLYDNFCKDFNCLNRELGILYLPTD